jgi:amino acid adenylation domain-containing protein
MTDSVNTHEGEHALSVGHSRRHELSGPAGGSGPDRPAHVLAAYEAWVRHAPHAPAVDDGSRVWTYAMLDAAADAIADTLRDGVRPGNLVGLCLTQSAALVASAIAVARLGAVHLLLGPRPAPQRLRALTETVGVSCLIGEFGAEVPVERTTLCWDPPHGDPGIGIAVGAGFPTGSGEPAVLAPGVHYVVLTSGSTGTPKPVVVDSAALAGIVAWYQHYTELGPSDRHSMFLHPSFDAHMMELWGVLCAGATLVVAPEATRADLGALTGWWREEAITVTALPTPVAEALLNSSWPAGLSLRHLMTGGDRLHAWPGPDVTATVHNAYGPSEATVLATANALPPRTDPADTLPPIGVPIAGAVVCVTDEQGNLVPRGVSGELLIGGPPLAVGYLDDELTARAFVAPPPGIGVNRVYRTGDRVTMRADGVVDFIGRVDDQLKVSGVRIEPAEVEAAIERSAAIRRAVLVPWRTPFGEVRLAVFAQRIPGHSPTVAQLVALAQAWLPEQAVPTLIHLVDDFPLDVNGKVDRSGLRARIGEAVAEPGDPALETGDAAPGEQVLLRLCSSILGLPALRMSDNFLESGGNSLATARLLAALHEQQGVRLRASEVLRQPDLRGIAALVTSRLAQAG